MSFRIRIIVLCTSISCFETVLEDTKEETGMMNLEIKVLENGCYMQGEQFLLLDAAAVFSHVDELLMLPQAMKWIGDACFELAALSVLKDGEDKPELRSYLNVRLRVAADAKDALGAAVKSASAQVQAWLSSIGADYQKVRFNDESMFSRMPVSGYKFIEKDKKWRAGGFTSVLRPVGKEYTVDIGLIADALSRNPNSGVSLQIMPGEWSMEEKEILEHNARGERVSEDTLRDTINGGIVCFVCAAWGNGAQAIINSVIGRHDSGLAGSLISQYGSMTAIRLVCDPWELHKRSTGRSRFGNILTMQELRRCFACKEERSDKLPVKDGVASADIAGVADMLLCRINKSMAQTIGSAAQRITDDISRTIRVSSAETGNQIKKEGKAIAAEMADLAQKQTGELNRTISVVSEQLEDQKKAFDNTALAVEKQSASLESIAGSMQQVREWQKQLIKQIEEMEIFAGEQINEFKEAIGRMDGNGATAVADVVRTVRQDMQTPLSQEALEFIGLSSETELGGLTMRQLSALRIVMAGLADTWLMDDQLRASVDIANPPSGVRQPDEEDLLKGVDVYILILGFLYEQIVRSIYHNKVFIRYIEFADPDYADLLKAGRKKNPELSVYDYCYTYYTSSKPQQTYYWDRGKMVRNFARGIRIGGRQYGEDYWLRMLDNMFTTRTARNTQHEGVRASGACRMVEAMLRSKKGDFPCLLKMLLALENAEVSFV